MNLCKLLLTIMMTYVVQTQGDQQGPMMAGGRQTRAWRELGPLEILGGIRQRGGTTFYGVRRLRMKPGDSEMRAEEENLGQEQTKD